ncbi:Nitrogen fixation protein VnfA [Thalassoglobus neptunius]|uniref:Nitrogen fixation protein VnfA n=1 Tax=Thalassoglobus neptunius TaxID=1938619 RepID=A0A5C5X5X3_9PLAN|nr:sigma-54-dependent Fis family transcriptional regulator [Thalassoglobus neptunius]TWT57595.1 Nitrogen fixation protein VnfA [Thalassoglobus neptunius]
MEESVWLKWRDLPWLQRSNAHASLIRACERILQLESLPEIVTDIAAEFGVPRCSVLERKEGWETIAARGEPIDVLPGPLLNDVVDQNAAVWSRPAGDDAHMFVATGSLQQHVLAFSGVRLDPAQLTDGLAIARVVGSRINDLARFNHAQQTVQRLRATNALAHTFAGETDTQHLLERIAEEASRLLGADRASIFIWDRNQRMLIACPALGVEGGKLFLPDNKGIIGETIESQSPVVVDNAYSDSRFDQTVDRQTGYKTRNLLSVPLFDAEGECIGAFELINKLDGDFTEDDLIAVQDFAVHTSIAIKNTLELENLVRSNQNLTERVSSGVTIIGENESIVALRGTIDRLAATELPVLILGESGTGKEVAAQALHHNGPRASKPFVAVNCAALTESLLESELFGHEKGAFTDAQSTHIGKFELAEGGTLFLDEIGDMSLGGQAKLLRVLEQKVITRVGGTQQIPVNVRIVAATNVNLTNMVAQKKFRQDLYYRLSVVTLEIPPLRERPEDVTTLARFFLKRFCSDAGRKTLEFTPEAEKRLRIHGWPGNVRELRNLMERVAFLAGGDRIEVEDLAFILSPTHDPYEDLSDGVGLADATNKFQREYIKRAVKRMQGNMSDAAEFLGLHRSNLYRKMRQLGMEVEEVKP